MARMITQILEFTRARLGGGFELDVSDANLGDLVHAVAAELRLGASAHIDVRTEGNLVGRWDADRLSQAISNVMGNAVDHATPDTAIVVDVHDEKDTLVLAIANEGKPIPPELLPVIFEPFRHGATDAREAGHMGLGLYIAREMGASHGGTLDVESSSGVTTFTFRLPRYPS
jgi:signal transduction histidine kinase